MVQAAHGGTGEGLWNTAVGGSSNDYLSSAMVLPGDSLLIGGTSFSDNNGDKSQATRGSSDMWILKLTSDGTPLWDARFGGSSSDGLNALASITEGYLLAGSSSSDTSGDKTQDSYGQSDLWIVAIDTNGTFLWDGRYGGIGSEGLGAAVVPAGGGILLAGQSTSAATGSKTEAGYGGTDAWLVKLDDGGTQQWDKTLGGSSNEIVSALLELTNGNFLLCGSSDSVVSGTKTSAPRGGFDFWISMISATGTHLWERSYGGSSHDFLFEALDLGPGGFLLAGYTESGASGDIGTPKYGGSDYWTVRIDGDGNILWEQRYGGAQDDLLLDVVSLQEGGWLLAGHSASDISGDKSEDSRGSFDYWILAVDTNGTVLWNRTYGGSALDTLADALVTPDSGLLLTGSSASGMDGEKSLPSQGFNDYWLIKAESMLDTDGDRLTDAREAFMGTSPGTADSDGDGLMDGDEYLAGTSPTNAVDYLHLEQSSLTINALPILTWNSTTNRTYTIQYKPDTTSSFLVLETGIAGLSPSVTWTGAGLAGDALYRIRVDSD